jgi:hypothetical protein
MPFITTAHRRGDGDLEKALRLLGGLIEPDVERRPLGLLPPGLFLLDNTLGDRPIGDLLLFLRIGLGLLERLSLLNRRGLGDLLNRRGLGDLPNRRGLGDLPNLCLGIGERPLPRGLGDRLNRLLGGERDLFRMFPRGPRGLRERERRESLESRPTNLRGLGDLPYRCLGLGDLPLKFRGGLRDRLESRASLEPLEIGRKFSRGRGCTSLIDTC